MLQNKDTKKKPLLRLIASSVTIFFLTTNTVLAAPPAGSASILGDSGQVLGVSQTPNSLPLTPDLGSVDEVKQGHTDKTIYYVQDAHDSLEAQENIAHIIRQLVKERGIQTVFEEGFEGPVPTDELFGFMEDKKGKEAVSYFLLDRLRLGGAEYAHVNREQDFKLIGVDSFKDYLENVSWYQQSAKTQKETDRDLNILTKHITKLSDRYFPKEIKEWMKLRERFDNKQLSLADYIFRLMQLAKGNSGKGVGVSLTPNPQPPTTNLSLLVNYLNKPKLTPEESKELEAKLKAIDAKTLFKEINQLEEDFAKRSLGDRGQVLGVGEKQTPSLQSLTPDQERNLKIYEYLKTLNLLRRLNHLELTPEEYEALLGGSGQGAGISAGNSGEVVGLSIKKTNPKSLFTKQTPNPQPLIPIKTEDLAKFIVQTGGKSVVLSKGWEQNIQQAIQFYELARKRDGAISTHLDQFLKDGKEKEAILVFGGFHKTGIKELLQKKGISYTVISPRITKADSKHEAYYRELMAKGYYPYEVGRGPIAARSLGVAALTEIAGVRLVLDYTRRLYEAYLGRRKNINTLTQPLSHQGRGMVEGNSIFSRFFEGVKSPALASILLSSFAVGMSPVVIAEELERPPAVKGEEKTSDAKVKFLTELLKKDKVSLDDFKPYLSDVDSVVVWHALQVIAAKKVSPVTAEFIKPYLKYKGNEGVVGLAAMIVMSQKTPIEIKDLDFLFQTPNLVPDALLVLEQQAYDVSMEFLAPYLKSDNVSVVWTALRVVKTKKKPVTLDFLKSYLDHTAPLIRNVAFEILRDQKIPVTFDFLKPYLLNKDADADVLRVILSNHVPVAWRDLRKEIPINKTGTELLMLKIAWDQKFEVPREEAEDFLATNRDIITEEIFKLAATGLAQISPDKIRPYFDYVDEEIAVTALQNAENPNFPLKGAEELRFALEHKNPSVVKAALNVIRKRNLSVTAEDLKAPLNSSDQTVRDEAKKLLEERNILIPKAEPLKEPVKGQSLGRLNLRVLGTALIAFTISPALMSAVVAEEVTQPVPAEGKQKSDEDKLEFLKELQGKEKVSFEDIKPYLDDPNSKVLARALQVAAVKKIQVPVESLKLWLQYKENREVVMNAFTVLLVNNITADFEDFDYALQEAWSQVYVYWAMERTAVQIPPDFLVAQLQKTNTAHVKRILKVINKRDIHFTNRHQLEIYLDNCDLTAREMLKEVRVAQPDLSLQESLAFLFKSRESQTGAFKIILSDRIPFTWKDLRTNATSGRTESELLALRIALDQKLRVSKEEAEDFLVTNRDVITEAVFNLTAEGLADIAPNKITPYLDYQDEKVALAALRAIRKRNYSVTPEDLKAPLNSSDPTVQGEAKKLLEERSVKLPSEPAKGQSLGQVIPIKSPNDISVDFNIAQYLDEPKVKKVIYIDFRNIQNNQLTPEQLNELYAYALLYSQFVELVVYHAVKGDRVLSWLEEVVPPERILSEGLNEAVAKFQHRGVNIQLSKEGVDPFKEADKITAQKVKFFRYQGSEVGLVTVALLYAELDRIHQTLAGIKPDGRGYFYIVGEVLQRLTQEYAGQLVVEYSA